MAEARTPNQIPLPYPTAQVRLQHLWDSLADDPETQALACAIWCVEHAPQLAAWLKAEIYRPLSDKELTEIVFHRPQDGRLQALEILSKLNQPVALPPSQKLTYYEYPPPPPVADDTPTRLQDGLTTWLSTWEVTPPEPKPEPVTIELILVDPELGRIVITKSIAALFRLWSIGRHLTRNASGSGAISRKALKAALKRFGVIYTRQHFNRLLKAGKGLFWNLSEQSIFLRSTQFVATQLISEQPQLAETNRPGIKPMYVSPVGTLEQWEATLYVAWMSARHDPTISRETLEKLFGRTANTLRRWEQTRLSDTLSIRKNYVQCHDVRTLVNIPPLHNQLYVAEVFTTQGRHLVERVYWQTSNSYQTKGIRQHGHRGQGRKVRSAINALYGEPADERRGGSHPPKEYFNSGEELRVYVEKHGNSGYLWRGENRHGHGIFEQSRDGFGRTHAKERADFATEYRYFKGVQGGL